MTDKCEKNIFTTQKSAHIGACTADFFIDPRFPLTVFHRICEPAKRTLDHSAHIHQTWPRKKSGSRPEELLCFSAGTFFRWTFPKECSSWKSLRDNFFDGESCESGLPSGGAAAQSRFNVIDAVNGAEAFRIRPGEVEPGIARSVPLLVRSAGR